MSPKINSDWYVIDKWFISIHMLVTLIYNYIIHKDVWYTYTLLYTCWWRLFLGRFATIDKMIYEYGIFKYIIPHLWISINIHIIYIEYIQAVYIYICYIISKRLWIPRHHFSRSPLVATMLWKKTWWVHWENISCKKCIGMW